MKEKVIDRKSDSYRIATVYGPLVEWEDDRWDHPMSSCRYHWMVLHGLFNLFLISLISLIFGIVLTDFVVWLYFISTNTFVVPFPGAIFTMAVISIFLTFGGIYLWNKLFNRVLADIPAMVTVREYKESLIDKICVPVRFDN